MNSTVGRFRIEKIHGKQYLICQPDSSGNPPVDSGSTDNNYLSVQTLFLCPTVRLESLKKQFTEFYEAKDWYNTDMIAIDSSPYYKRERLGLNNHHYVLPLFWCKNKNKDLGYDGYDGYDDYDDYHGGYNSCKMCTRPLRIGTDYYFCGKCDKIYHKECIESPPEIKHPYHPSHPLIFFYLMESSSFVYHCTLCNITMDTFNALKPILFVIEKTKRHDHPLTFFTRKDHLRCNVCGLINHNHSTYVCLKCDFVVHQDCADFPSVIMISRHHHRIFFTSYLQPGRQSCGICRKDVDSDYGAYTCNKCDDYVFHPKCALRKDIWDGKELKGIPEEDDIEEINEPFKRISDGSILHFLHSHVLKSEERGEFYDESKICHACVIPIYEGKFYSCIQCDFILHDNCANAPRKKRHPLHPHPLTLKLTSEYNDGGFFECDACYRLFSGFVYECNIEENCFILDVRCGSIFEPFIYQGHAHPLFLSLDPGEKYLCQVCQKNNKTLINCLECDFMICLKCVTLPYMVRYKHDNHFITLVHEKETNEPDWCEICERLLISSEEETKRRKGEDIEDKRFYECKQCCTTLHINCLLGNTPYMKPGHTLNHCVRILANNSFSRPSCDCCEKRCVDKKIFKIFLGGSTLVTCCLDHALQV